MTLHIHYTNIATKTPAKLNPKDLFAVVEVAPPEDIPVLSGEGIPLLVDVGYPGRVDEGGPRLVLDERLKVSLEGGWPWGFVHPMSIGTRY
jgi:hypothetical protein